jgi:hypothetical protein
VVHVTLRGRSPVKKLAYPQIQTQMTLFPESFFMIVASFVLLFGFFRVSVSACSNTVAFDSYSERQALTE